jgi:hypothetical protein
MKIEELHRPHSKIWDCNNDIPLEENHALKSSEITTDVAIKFAEFSSQYYDEDLTKDQWFNHSLNAEKKILTTQELFEEFINNHYGK